MYKIEKRPSGFLLTFGGFIQKQEMEQWLEESRKALMAAPPEFGVIIDMRTLNPLPKDAQDVMVTGQQMYKVKGMKRSAVILANPTTTIQFKRLAQESGIYAFERYIDASVTPDWSQVALDWVKSEIDPDKKK